MDSLKRVILINAAKYGYSEFAVDGNTLIIGANGAGKTSFLRALLYFYTADIHSLGLSRKNRRFIDFYLPYENSYLLYFYQKGSKENLVVIYKSSNTIQYRFCLLDRSIDVRELFFKDDQALQRDEVFERLREVGYVSSAIKSPKDYKRILYAKDKQYPFFSLFEAKRGYESFAKIIANIFINSKVDSESIKKVLIDSIALNQDCIDLEIIQRELRGFNTFYEDILIFERSRKRVERVIEHLLRLQKLQDELQQDLYALAFSKDELKKLLPKKKEVIEELVEEIAQVTKSIKDLQDRFERQRAKLIKEIGVVEEVLKRVKVLKIKYKDIEKKLVLFRRLDIKKEQLQTLLKQRDFLSSSYKKQLSEYENLIKEIENSTQKAINDLDGQQLKIEKDFLQKISLLDQEAQNQIMRLTQSEQKRALYLNEEIHRIELEIRQIEFLQQQRVDFIYQKESQLQEALKKKRDLEEQERALRRDLEEAQKELEFEARRYEEQKEHLEHSFNEKRASIQKELKRVEAFMSKENLASLILQRSKEAQKYFFFLKDEVLERNFDVEFKSDSEQLFEIVFQDLSIPRNPLQQRKRDLKKRLDELLESAKEEFEHLEKEFVKAQKRQEKRRRSLKEQLDKIHRELLRLKRVIENLQEEKERQKSLFEKEQQKKQEQLQKSLEGLEQARKKLQKEQEAFKKELEQKIISIKSNFTKKKNRLKLQEKKLLEEIKEEKRALLEQKEQQIKKQKELFQSRVGEDEAKRLDALEEQIATLKKEIESIESYQREIFAYEKDKEEYLDKELYYKKELKEKRAQLEEIEHLFKERLDRLSKEKKIKEEKLDRVKKEVDAILKDLKDISFFEESSELQKLFTMGLCFEAREGIMEDVGLLLKSIRERNIRYEEEYEELNKGINQLEVFGNSLKIQKDIDPIKSARNLKEYLEYKKIEEAKDLLTKNLDNIVKDIINRYHQLLDFQKEVQPLIQKISKVLDDVSIGVIDRFDLRYSETDNSAIELFRIIKEEYLQNYGLEANLFMPRKSTKLVDLLKQLVDLIEKDDLKRIDFKDSFILEFRVIENGNDSGFLPSLDGIGSHGTDILVKGLIYIAMIDLFKRKATKKSLFVHAILDEIGVLSQRYLKELIRFANEKGIFFVNGAPDEKLVSVYKRVYLIERKGDKSKAVELILNETR